MVLASIATVIHSFIVLLLVRVRRQAEINKPEINMNTSIFVLILLVTVCSAAPVPILSPRKGKESVSVRRAESIDRSNSSRTVHLGSRDNSWFRYLWSAIRPFEFATCSLAKTLSSLPLQVRHCCTSAMFSRSLRPNLFETKIYRFKPLRTYR